MLKKNLFVNLSVITNITLEPYFSKSIKERIRDEVKINYINFNEYNEQKNIEKIMHSKYLIIILSLYEIIPNISTIQEYKNNKKNEIKKYIISLATTLHLDILKNYNGTILWFLFEDYNVCLYKVIGNIYNSYVDEINILLKKKINKNVIFIDTKKMISLIGINKSYDLKNKYRWNSPYSSEFINILTDEIYKQFLIINGYSKKCLILDCDNVLWKGIISEDTVHGVKLGNDYTGKKYQDFQRFILSLYNRGVILAICSKNDIDDVLYMFREHEGMILKEEHISVFEVNWNSKALNIMKIAKFLNIDLSSIVFIDDSKFEIESVNFLLPEVKTILFNNENFNLDFDCFNLSNDINMSIVKSRNKTYQTNILRERLKENCENYDEYINNLGMVVSINETKKIEINRIAELTRRANKCTNGKRYNDDELLYLFENSDLNIYTVSVKDRYSNLGLVGAFGIFQDTIDFFVLSCRALGRNVEKIMLKYIKDKFIIKQAKFLDTGKNEIIINLCKEIFVDINIIN